MKRHERLPTKKIDINRKPDHKSPPKLLHQYPDFSLCPFCMSMITLKTGKNFSIYYRCNNCIVRCFYTSEENLFVFLSMFGRFIYSNKKALREEFYNLIEPQYERKNFPQQVYCIVCGKKIMAKLDKKGRAFMICSCYTTLFHYDPRTYITYRNIYMPEIVRNIHSYRQATEEFRWLYIKLLKEDETKPEKRSWIDQLFELKQKQKNKNV